MLCEFICCDGCRITLDLRSIDSVVEPPDRTSSLVNLSSGMQHLIRYPYDGLVKRWSETVGTPVSTTFPS